MVRDEDRGRQNLLAEILKSLRRHRSLSAGEVAAAMGLPLRTYEHFEAGRGRLNPQRVRRFAEVLDVDAFAIFAALDFGSPAFALHCADNKLMTILMKAVSDFDASAQDAIGGLEATSLIAAFTRTFADLKTQALAQHAFVARWMADNPLKGEKPED
jgi:transcriptional regulator with XRE-family HTH domain